MVAFIDNPAQIAVVIIVILLLFGPEKMKEICRMFRDRNG